MITFLLITLSIMSLIFFKYVIDTKSTIKELNGILEINKCKLVFK